MDTKDIKLACANIKKAYIQALKNSDQETINIIKSCNTIDDNDINDLWSAMCEQKNENKMFETYEKNNIIFSAEEYKNGKDIHYDKDEYYDIKVFNRYVQLVRTANSNVVKKFLESRFEHNDVDN